MKAFFSRLKASSWIIKLRFASFILSIAFFFVMFFFSILYCKSTNRKFLIPSLSVLLLLKFIFFLYFSVKIGGIESTLKGPIILPGTLYCTLPIAFMAMPVLVYRAGSRTIAGLFVSILFIPIAAFFKFAASLDTNNIATQTAVGATLGLCCATISVYGERLAFIPGAVTVDVAFLVIWMNGYLEKRVKQASGDQ